MKQKTKQSRRNFLKGAAAASGAAVVVAATGQHAVAAEEIEAVTLDKKAKGYQETQHVRDYYDSTRS